MTAPFSSDFLSFLNTLPLNNQQPLKNQTAEEEGAIWKLLNSYIQRQQEIVQRAIEEYKEVQAKNKNVPQQTNATGPRTHLIDELADFNKYIEQEENKKALKAILQVPAEQDKLHKALETVELEEHKKLIESIPNPQKLEWQGSIQQITNPETGIVYCDLKKTQSENIKVHLANNSYVDITNRETIDFPMALNEGSGTFQIFIAARNQDNQPSSKVPGFSAHYDDAGKLKSISCPQMIKFAGIGPDAVGYIEKDGEVYTLPVTRGKYKELNKQLEINNGIKPIDISPKNNYEVLQDNKKELLEQVGSLPDKGKLSDEDKNQKMRETLAEVKVLVANSKVGLLDNFSKAIDLLDERKDLAHGITRTISDEFESGTKAMVRDARNVTTDPKILKKDRPEKYAMQILNEVRATINLIDFESKDQSQDKKDKGEDAKEKLLFVAQNALENIEELDHKSVQNYNKIIFDTYKKTQKQGVLFDWPSWEKELKAKIVFSMQMTNFDHEHHHIVTLSKIKDNEEKSHAVIEADIMLNGTIPALKHQFDAIALNYKKEKGELLHPTDQENELINFCSSEDLKWYRDLPDYKRDMIGKNAEKIASGKYIIPTQLLESMPGVRNAYDKVTAVNSYNDITNKYEMEIVNENMHCGTPATKLGKGASWQKIVSDNIDFIRSFTKNGNTNLLSFNHAQDLSIVAKGQNERPFMTQLRQVANDNKNVKYSALPLNGFRNIADSGEDTTYFKEYLADLGKGLSTQNTGMTEEADLKRVSEYLQKGGKGPKAITNLIDKASIDTKAKKTLIAAVEVRGLIDGHGNDAGNRHLTTTNKLSYLETQLNQENNPLHGIVEPYTRIEFCKSGKDRTGYAQIKNTLYSVFKHLDIKNNQDLGMKVMTRYNSIKKLAKDITLALTAGGHSQEMTGIQGGTIGAHCIKHSPVLWHTLMDKVMDGILNQKSAGFNSGLRTSKAKDEVVENFNKAFRDQESSKNILETKASKLQQIKRFVSSYISNPGAMSNTPGKEQGRGTGGPAVGG
ncbi:MAG: Sca4 family protein [Rickettsiaceae bacterium]|nr:Sca4 family protein [Rickettsiaceae bacterium]